jgi:hypothetical protein
MMVGVVGSAWPHALDRVQFGSGSSADNESRII